MGIPGVGIPEEAVSINDYALPLTSLTPPPPPPRFIFALSQSPRTRLSRILEQAKETYTDLADTPFPLPFPFSPSTPLLPRPFCACQED